MESSYKLNLFYWLYANPLSALWYNFKKVIARMLRRLLDALEMGSGINGEAVETIAGLISLGLVLAALGLLLYGIYKLIQRRQASKTKRKLFGHEIDGTMDWDHFLNRGEVLSAEGNYTEAIRAEFVGLLLLLESQSTVHILEAWTTTEIGDALFAAAFVQVKQYTAVATNFNRWCYGPIPDLKDYKIWRQELMPLWHLVAGGAKHEG